MATKSTLDVDPQGLHDSQHFNQDYEDGAALRRLREALPRGYVYELVHLPNGLGDWVRVYVNEADQSAVDDHSVACEMGDTIEEAADKCRRGVRDALR